MTHIKIQCPAKINLTLKITGTREDGFHNLESIMQTISLYDYLTITVEASENFSVKLSGNSKEIPYNEKNLVYKAIELYLNKINDKNYHITVFIDKNIPVAAGLAGGSTDAAGTLYGLNQLFNNRLNKTELHNLCSKLGSDLNFCLEGGTQYTSGRGEILKPAEFKKQNISLIKPLNVGISAKEAYTKFSLKKEHTEKGRENYINDLEWAVIDDYKELQYIKDKYPDAIMSGSGSTYFIIGKNFNNDKGYWIENNLTTISFGVTEIND